MVLIEPFNNNKIGITNSRELEKQENPKLLGSRLRVHCPRMKRKTYVRKYILVGQVFQRTNIYFSTYRLICLNCAENIKVGNSHWSSCPFLTKTQIPKYEVNRKKHTKVSWILTRFRFPEITTQCTWDNQSFNQR